MFPDNIIATAEKRGLEEGRREGRQEGRQEGEARGQVKGEAAALARLLTHRFGELAPDIQARIEAAELTEIIAWFERALGAADLEAVFRAD
ncbi:MAG: DUF4351 domain-containing protein [Burkholderiaceae bacterium]